MDSAVEVLSRGGKSTAAGRAEFKGRPMTALDHARANVACSHKQAEIAYDETREVRRQLETQRAANVALLARLCEIRTVAEKNPAVKEALKDLLGESTTTTPATTGP